MKLACLTFTSSGERLAYILKASLNHEVDLILRSDDNFKGSNLKERFIEIFNSYEGIIFISSTGIAVRYIAPYVKDKTTDPAVVVLDDMGRYSISLLSGHLGGANSLADEVAKVISATPIITTASDSRGIEAVDMFAKRLNLYIDDMNAAKVITALMIEGKRIKTLRLASVDESFLSHESEEVDGIIAITPYIIDTNKYNPIPICILRPKTLNIGIGCRKGKSVSEIRSAIIGVFKDNNLSINSIKSIATIDVKAKESGIIEASKEFGCKLKIFESHEVKKVQDNFTQSDFVHKSIGVKSVSEPCAYLAGGRIIVNKTAIDGITVAVSIE